MKNQSNRNVIVFATTLAFAASQFLSAAASSQAAQNKDTTPATQNAVSPDSASAGRGSSLASVERRMQQLDNQLDSIFSDTFRDFDQWFATSDLSSSIDLKEQKDKYVARVYVPNSDTTKVQASVQNNALHVTAEGEQKNGSSKKSERYEQILSLPGPVQGDKMKIERKKNLVVIELPKANDLMAGATPAPHSSIAPRSDDLASLDQSIIDRMSRMQGRMEQIFRDAFPHDLTNGFNTLQLSSAANIDDQKDKYVARFYLPDKDLKDVSVELKDGQLHLTASESSSSQQGAVSNTESGRYEQILSLPGPVNEKGMKVQRKNGTIVVTVPKQ